MERGAKRGRAWRAAFGVLMLYAFVLQSVFGSAAATRMSLQPRDVICLSHAGESTEDQDGQAEHENCCATACRLAQATLAVPTSEAIATPAPSPAPERCWLAIRFHAPPAVPEGSTRPRAPPAAA